MRTPCRGQAHQAESGEFWRGPDLVAPRPELRIVPGRLAGEPHIRGTRIGTLQIAALAPPCPTAIVLMHPEYEVLFLPCLATMAGEKLDGRPGLQADTRWDGSSWEARRGVKEWLSKHFQSGRAYKPTLDQLPLTRLIDIQTLRKASVSCYGTLERAVGFLAENYGGAGVYPSPEKSGTG